MVFQLDDVYQYLASRFDDRLLLVVIPINGRTRRRMRFQKLINRCPHPRTAYNTTVFGVNKPFDGLQFGYILVRPDQPNLLRALLSVELEPTLLGNLNLLISIQERRAVVSRLGRKHYDECRNLLTLCGRAFVEQI